MAAMYKGESLVINRFLHYKQLAPLFLTSVLLLVTANSFAGFFNKGARNLSLVVGSGNAFNENYTILGAGLGYYVLDGLELGFDAQYWMGGEPSISKLSPQLQYVFARHAHIKPYLGAFFRRTSIDGFDDLDSSGARLGVFFTSDAGHYFGVGFVNEKYLDCNETVLISCSDSYPEITIRFVLN